MKLSKSLFIALTMTMMVVIAVQAADPTGAIFTTTPNGSIVNENVRYNQKIEVYLDGGPGPNAPQSAAGLDDGWYVFQVTDPSGKNLLSAEYFGRGKKPWEAFEDYWRVSPLKYITNAKTPTLIHVVDGDPRVPRPQSEELHMAMKQRGVPTEFFVYPGNTHGIPDARNQYLKAVAEFTWFEKWIRGKPWFTWKELLATLEEPQSEK